MTPLLVPFCCLVLLAVNQIASAESPLVMTLETLPELKRSREFTPLRGERNIDLQSSVSKQLSDEEETRFTKKKRADHRIKHPLLITKDDIETQDAIVEDNIIVKSNVLHLVRPAKRFSNNILRVKRSSPKESLIPHKRVARGWNLQHVIVPDYPYYNTHNPSVTIPDSKRWSAGHVKRSKVYDDYPIKNAHRGWALNAQQLQAWPTKLYG